MDDISTPDTARPLVPPSDGRTSGPPEAAGPEPRPRPPRDPRPVVNVPGGQARLHGEVAIRPDGRPDEELVVQALESTDGEPLLRVGYRRAGRMLRGPVTTSAAELAAVADALRSGDLLAGPFRSLGGPAPRPSRRREPAGRDDLMASSG